jgi:phosphoesterase RecJ-like protein
MGVIEQQHKFIITSHVNPDCDALGSELALAEHLGQLGKEVTILNSDPVPTFYRFLDPKRHIRKYSQAKHSRLIEQAEVIFVVDASGGWQRTGPVGQALAQARACKICIDHHPDAADFVDIALIDIEAAATAELIFELVLTMGGSISSLMAQALYAAIITDTGNFRFPKTSSRTHRITAELLATGVDPMHIYRQIYEQYPLARIRLKGHVMSLIQTAAAGQIAYYSLDQATLKKYGVKSSALDGFASLGQEIGGVRVTIFCLETSKSKVKLSLRSDGSLPINSIAAAYEGGGHPSAAGATISGSLPEIMQAVLTKAKDLLENSGSGEAGPG